MRFHQVFPNCGKTVITVVSLSACSTGTWFPSVPFCHLVVCVVRFGYSVLTGRTLPDGWDTCLIDHFSFLGCIPNPVRISAPVQTARAVLHDHFRPLTEGNAWGEVGSSNQGSSSHTFSLNQKELPAELWIQMFGS